MTEPIFEIKPTAADYTEIDLRKLVDTHMEVSHRHLSEKRHIHNCVFLLAPHCSAMFVLDTIAREIAPLALWAIRREIKAKVAIHISEAWRINVRNDDPLPPILPRYHADRTECVIICARTQTGEVCYRTDGFTRNGREFVFGPPEYHTDATDFTDRVLDHIFDDEGADA